MNIEIFKTPDPSGRMSKESFLLKNHEEEYKYIISFCEENELTHIPFKEKVYLSINRIKSKPICKNLNCINIVKFKNSTLGYLDYCSNKCISSDPNIKKSKEHKSLIKYGTKSPTQSKEVKDKTIKTNQERYGGNSAMSSRKVQEKSRNTLLLNYGVDHPSKNTEILKRRIESFKSSSYKESYKKSSLNKYGVEHPWMNKEIHNKTIESFYSEYRTRIENQIDKINFRFIRFNKGISTTLSFECSKCNKEFDILTYQFYYRNNNKVSICTNCHPIAQSTSIAQTELYDFIKESYKGDVYLNVRNIINPHEIDIYIPDLKLGFEFNGVWWHSDKFKEVNYHKQKHESATDKDVKLFSIWEDDWITKREICKSFILNKIGKNTNKIYARKCVVKKVMYLESKSFLDNNHLQGDCKSSIRLGIFHEDDLVGLMTFSKIRLPLQKSKLKRDIDNHYELTRFCNKVGTNVIGGASKLFSYFLTQYQPEQIETYSDNLISNGDLYNRLGFEYSHTSKPGYWYVIDGIRSHRFNWRKQKLVKMGYDENKTESEIMSEMGHYRIYNGGNKKWIYKNKNDE